MLVVPLLHRADVDFPVLQEGLQLLQHACVVLLLRGQLDLELPQIPDSLLQLLLYARGLGLGAAQARLGLCQLPLAGRELLLGLLLGCC